MVKKKARKKSKRSSSKARRGLLYKILAVAVVAGVCVLVYFDARVRYTFAERKWAEPARVYARPLELYRGLALSAAEVEQELQLLGYRAVTQPAEPGEYQRQGNSIKLVSRGFRFWDGAEESQRASLVFAGSRLQQLDSKTASALLRLEPLQIGSIYPAHNEDRILVLLDQVPSDLVNMLVAMEDRNFYRHWGLSPTAIARAAWVNMRAGGYVQGGSTLTQQLVKNYYLTPQRSLVRKATEAVMAVSLDLHYSKEEILEGYINEIFLGQDGARAIHGFGLASQYYFNQPLEQLPLHKQATLVALVRGPSYYDPWRHPKRAIERRNLVLAALRDQGYAEAAEVERAQLMPLGVGERFAGSRLRYPAYLDLVRRQLQRDYQAEDLASEGLVIFTNLDPRIQQGAEKALAGVVEQVRKDRPDHENLQGAVIIGQAETGAVLAVVGGRDPRFAGFNRALDAQRPIGSLIKPAVYLTALSSGDYTLATGLLDESMKVELPNGDSWSPSNFDKESHGEVPLFVALARSYNQATARLGLQLGVDNVLQTLQALGVERELPAVPSILLGSRGLSLLEVAQYYQTIASGGFYTPLQAIRAVTSGAGERLSRYDIEIDQRVDRQSVLLLQAAMQQVAQWGTGRGVRRYVGEEFAVAVKTGTSDQQRDSWFAGFSGDLLGVAWLGMDNNSRTALTGSSGALRVWGEIFRDYSQRPLMLQGGDAISYRWVDEETGALSAENCDGAHWIPFISETEPTESTPCGLKADKRGWFKKMLGRR